MKRIKKSACPPELSKFASEHSAGHPKQNWKEFHEDLALKRNVQEQLVKDQRGLCAYCEIDLSFTPRNHVGGGVPKGDFRIEHFHPKEKEGDTSHNWTLDWNNMLATCSGGDEKELLDKERIAVKRPDLHCDSRKHDKDLSDSILNPLEMPAFPALFECELPEILTLKTE